MRVHTTLLAISGLLLSCSDAALYQPLVQPISTATLTVNGQFCEDKPAMVNLPVKLTFVIDDTGSMATNDPGQKRYTAAAQLAQQLNQPGVIYFAAITFAENGGSNAVLLQDFTDDGNLFAQVLTQRALQPPAGGTPTVEALNFTHDFLVRDLTLDPLFTARATYGVIFLSDGIPEPAEPDNSVYGAVDGIMNDVGPKTMNTTVSAVFLGADDPHGPVLMQGIAQHGHGQFVSFPAGGNISYDFFNFPMVQRTYVFRSFFLVNQNIVPDGSGQAMDSDGDGLSDTQEAKLGTNPASRDTDGDGCSDPVEVYLGWDPTTPGGPHQCNCVASDLQDTDGDGLNDCEERYLGTEIKMADSDIDPATAQRVGDGVPDLFDLQYLQDPTHANLAADNRDSDGVGDLDEYLTGMSPFVGDNDFRDKWAYVYQPIQDSQNQPGCHDFQVENIHLGPVLQTADHPADTNVIVMGFLQTASDDPLHKVFYLAKKLVPASNSPQTVHVSPSDFSIQLKSYQH